MKRLLSKLTSRHKPVVVQDSEAKAVLDQIIDEVIAACREQMEGSDEVIGLKASARWRALMNEPADAQVSVALAALTGERPDLSDVFGWEYHDRLELPFKIARFILQKKALKIGQEQISGLLGLAIETDCLDHQFPVSAVLGACERHLAGQKPTGTLQAALIAFVRRVGTETYISQAKRKMGLRARAMLNPDVPGGSSGFVDGAFAGKFFKWAGKDPYRVALANHLNEAFDKSKPSKSWRDQGSAHATRVEGLWDQLGIWLEQEVPDPQHPDPSFDILKSMIWLAPPKMARQIGQFCQVCFTKVPEVGPRSAKLGNACLLGLEQMGPKAASISELSRLSQKIKYLSVGDQIEKRLTRLAQSAGVSVADLEDRSLPDFGLDENGAAQVTLGMYTATLLVTGTGTVTEWQSADRKRLKSIPKPVRDNNIDALKSLKSRKKDIENGRKSTVTRLEASWTDRSDWDLDEWVTLFENHPLRRQVAHTLVWQITSKDRVVSGLRRGNAWIGPDGTQIMAPQKARVSLWHPLNSRPEEVLAWRRRIVKAGFMQPIKQVYREIYVLTEAERQTEIYSNRFAAHILRQHQFKALCDARGWRYSLMGAHFDGHNIPQRRLPSIDLTAQYSVEIVEGAEESEMGIASHLVADQFSFIDGSNQRVPLREVAPIVVSEVMRDVDLFVAVASVANDPSWTDGGPEGRFGGYWVEHAFGDLSQSAQTRKELLEDILPSLSIAPMCHIEGKFLVVNGKLNDYAIHLGSSNIQILPSHRYLCIVPTRRPKAAARLPYDGDMTFSVILSKAYALVDDDKITDTTILMQLRN